MASNISNSVLSWYVDAEDMLQDVLRYVPYCLEHKSVWSPKLVTILHEVCSQLDSLWFYEAIKSPFVKEDRLNIKNYETVASLQSFLLSCFSFSTASVPM